MKTKYFTTLFASCLVIFAGTATAFGFSAAGNTYKLDDGAINSFGGDASSSLYRLTDSGGEPFVGFGTGTNYKFNAGYVAQLEHSIALSLDSLAVTLPAVTPGTSQTASSTVSVFTDAAGYLLAARYDNPLKHLTSPTTTIADVGATIASPALWSEGTTKGFGFTLTSGTSLDAKWGSSPNYKYAALVSADTTIHDQPTYRNVWDATAVQYRLDVPADQLAGSYRSNVTYSATVKP